MDYRDYQHILVEKEDGVALVTLNRPEAENRSNTVLHQELGRIWLDLARDQDVRAVVVTGAGVVFSAGGDPQRQEARTHMERTEAAAHAIETMEEIQAIVYNLINLDKPVVSAINGYASGAGLSVALLADISIAREDARIADAHVLGGVAAGDHAAILWPLLCGMAKAKRYILLGEPIDAREAERVGLISMVVPGDQLMSTAMEVARKLASGSQVALRLTKRALNQWLRLAGITSFDYSAALEVMTFMHGDMREAVQARKEGRPPAFPSAT